MWATFFPGMVLRNAAFVELAAVGIKVELVWLSTEELRIEALQPQLVWRTPLVCTTALVAGAGMGRKRSAFGLEGSTFAENHSFGFRWPALERVEPGMQAAGIAGFTLLDLRSIDHPCSFDRIGLHRSYLLSLSLKIKKK